MVGWYAKVLGAEVIFRLSGGASLANNGARHRVALLLLGVSLEGQDGGSRPPTAGTPPPRRSSTGTRKAAPIALLRPPVKKTGGLSAISLPTTTELPTGTIAAVSPRYALKFPFTS